MVSARRQIVASLKHRLRRWERARKPVGDELISSGCPALDEMLPQTGFRRGTLVEWIASAGGSGAGTLALLTAREAHRAGGSVVVFDRSKTFYPAAAAALGIDLSRLLIVRPGSAADEDWALDQALRSRNVAAVLAWRQRVNDRLYRRLQLAAEQSGAMGLLVRPAAARDEPSWAAVRLLVEPATTGAFASRRWRITVWQARGELAGGSVEVIRDEHHDTWQQTSGLRLAASLAAPAGARRSRRA